MLTVLGLKQKTLGKSPKVSGNTPYYNRFLPHLCTSTSVSKQGTKKAFSLPNRHCFVFLPKAGGKLLTPCEGPHLGPGAQPHGEAMERM